MAYTNFSDRAGTGGPVSSERGFEGPVYDSGGQGYNVKHATYGATGDGTTDDRAAFAAADTAAGGATIFVPSGTYVFDSDITISSPVAMAGGAVLKPASGVTVTLTTVDAGLYQIFDLSSGGTIALTTVALVYPQWWGAAGDGTTDDTTALQAAIDAAEAAGGGTVYISPGAYLVTSSLTVENGDMRLIGAGMGAEIKASSVTGPVVIVGESAAATEGYHLADFRISGSATSGVQVSPSTNINHSTTNVVLERIHLGSPSGGGTALTATDGFDLRNTYGSCFRDLSTNGSTISNACFKTGTFFNANVLSNLYTSNFCTYNFYFDGDQANYCQNLVAQGGDNGIFFREGDSWHIDTFYTENVVKPLVIGINATNNVSNCQFTNLYLSGAYSSHPQLSDREAAIDLDYAVYCSFDNVHCLGLFNIGNSAPVSFSGGGGSGAIAVARMNDAGAIQSIEVLNGGSGYTAAPTVTIGGSGSSATATASITGDEVTSISVDTAGTGYDPSDGYLVFCTYNRAEYCVFRNVTTNTQGTNVPANAGPQYAWLVHKSGANTASGITIHDCNELVNSNVRTRGTLYKEPGGYNYNYHLVYIDSSGARQTRAYTAPAFTP